MAAGAHSQAPYYFVPSPSHWPAVGSVALLCFGFGMSGWVNGAAYGPWLFALFLAILVFMMVGWFGAVAAESESGMYNHRVDTAFRWSMGWFIFSEVMFFAAFFGALYYARTISMPWLGDLDHKSVLWPDFQAVWPNLGPAGVVDTFQTIGPWPIPTINTALLLASGVTLTIAHHALKESRRGSVVFWLFVTILLGAVFLAFQGASGDNHPVHYDVEYCKTRGMPGLLAHGLQTLAQTAPGAGLFPFLVEDCLVGFIEQSSKFLKPVFSGDTLYSALEIDELTPGRTTGVLGFRTTIHNQRRELVLEGRQRYLLRRRAPAS